jgi:hypothetical protein
MPFRRLRNLDPRAVEGHATNPRRTQFVRQPQHLFKEALQRRQVPLLGASAATAGSLEPLLHTRLEPSRPARRGEVCANNTRYVGQ